VPSGKKKNRFLLFCAGKVLHHERGKRRWRMVGRKELVLGKGRKARTFWAFVRKGRIFS